MGRMDAREGMGLEQIVEVGVCALAFWQALTSPRIEQVIADEDEE